MNSRCCNVLKLIAIPRLGASLFANMFLALMNELNVSHLKYNNKLINLTFVVSIANCSHFCTYLSVLKDAVDQILSCRQPNGE